MTDSEGRQNGHSNLRPFRPGQSGNPGGRPKEVLRPMLVIELARQHRRGKVSKSKAEWIVENLCRLAMSNRPLAVHAGRLILEYVDGKPDQNLNVYDEREQQLRIAEIRAALGIEEAS